MKPAPATVATAEELTLLGQALLSPAGDPELEIEYNRLFLNPLGAPCPPWQSMSLPEPSLFGPTHHAALEWYRAFGSEPALDNEPADHAGLLILFYAHLLQRGCEASALARFHQEHLAWVRPWAEHLKTEARHPFYVWVAGCLSASLEAGWTH